MHHAAGLGVGHQRAERALKVDAEMLVEAPVLGRQHRLDQMVRKLVERHQFIVLDAAVADFVAVAVEEGDGEIGFLQPVVVGGLAESRNREYQQQEQSAGAERRHFRQWLDQHPTPPAGDVEAIHGRGEALIEFPRPLAGLKDRKIDAGVDIEQQPLELGPPVVARIGEHVRHYRALRKSAGTT